MEISVRHLFILSVLGSILIGVSFPFTGSLFPLAFVGFVPLLLINFQLNKVKKWRIAKRFLFNYLYFVIFNTITTWWIYNASPGGVYMAVLANSLLMTIPMFLTGFTSRFLGENKGLLAFLAFWLSFEFAHYLWELSWPWLSLGHIFGNHPMLIQWYSVSGVTGGSLWILVVNIFVYMIIRNVWIRKETWRIQTPLIWFVGLTIAFPIISSVIMYYNYEEKEDPVNIAVIQPNFDAYTEKFIIPLSDQLDIIFDIADEHITEETDLILLPETAISRRVNEDHLDQESSIQKIKNFLRSHHNVSMLTGADSYRFYKEEQSLASSFNQSINAWVETYNSAFLIDPNRPTQVYHKAKPVLGAEKVPFLSWFPQLKKYSVELGGTSSMIGLGKFPINFDAGGFKFAPLICYESVYGNYVTFYTATGADILCVITNDGWWGDTPGYRQHRSFSQIRAIENRRSLARSANTGISCFIDQRGEILKEIGWNERGGMQMALNRNQEITFFVKYGDVFGRISLFLAIAMFIYAITNYAKTTGLADKAKLTRKK